MEIIMSEVNASQYNTDMARARFLCEVALLLDHARNNDLSAEERANAAIYTELLHIEAKILAGKDCYLIYQPDENEDI